MRLCQVDGNLAMRVDPREAPLGSTHSSRAIVLSEKVPEIDTTHLGQLKRYAQVLVDDVQIIRQLEDQSRSVCLLFCMPIILDTIYTSYNLYN